MKERRANDSAAPDDGAGVDAGIPMSFYLRALWPARRLVVSVVLFFAFLGFVFALVKEPEYLAQAVIEPSVVTGGSGGQLSNLALAAGLSFGGSNANTFDKFQHLLQSSRLAEALQRNHHVLQTLYATQWDSVKRQWIVPDDPVSDVVGAIRVVLGRPAWRPPSAATLEKRLSKMVTLSEAPSGAGGINALKSQAIQIAVKYKDRDYAIRLLNWILEDADATARQDEMADTENRVEYLDSALRRTTEVTLANSLTQILLDQERVLMMVKSNRHYAFDMVDVPHADIYPAGLGLAEIVVLAAIFGFVVSVIITVSLVRRRVTLAEMTGRDPFADAFPDPVAMIWKSVRGRRAITPFRTLPETTSRLAE